MSDNGGKFDMSDYVDVAERITAFREKHPEGSFQVRLVELPEAFSDKFVAVEAKAYRAADDACPGQDIAWEPVPGKTPYTRDSELQNASTSAVGRAIVYALAADTHKGVASAQEVRNRSEARTGGSADNIEPSDKQLDYLVALAKKGGGDVSDQENIRAYAKANATGGREGTLSPLIDKLKGGDAAGALAKLATRANEWTAATLTDVPADDPAEPAPDPDSAEIPF